MRIDDCVEYQRLEVKFAVILKEFGRKNCQWHVLDHIEHVIARYRCVVYRQYVDLDRRRHGETRRVGDRVAKRDSAPEISRRRNPVLAVFKRRDRSIGRIADKSKESERAAFGIIIISHQDSRVDVDIAVFQRSKPVIGNRDWNVELRQDCQRYAPDIVIAIAVGNPIGKACIAVIACAGGKDRRAAIHDHAAIIAIEQFDNGKAVAFYIAVIGEQCGEIDDQRLILFADKHAAGIIARADTVCVGDRAVIHRCDCNREASGGFAPAIGDRIAQARYATYIFIRNEAEASAGQPLNPALGVRHFHRDKAHGIAVEIAVVRQQISGGEFERRIFIGRKNIGERGGCAVGRLHINLRPAGTRSIDIVGDYIIETCRAAEIDVGCKDNVGPVKIERAVNRVKHRDKADGIAIDIAVVGKELRRGDAKRYFLDGRETVENRIRRFVAGSDSDTHGSAAVALQIVGYHITKAVGARISRIWRVSDACKKLAIEHPACRTCLAVAAERRCPDDIEILAQIERHGRGDRTGCGIDGHPGRQIGATCKFCAPACAFQNHRRRRAILHNAVVDDDRAVPRSRDRLHAQIVAIIFAVVAQEIHEREGQGLVFDRCQIIGDRIGAFGGGKDVEDDDPAILRNPALFIARGVA